MLPYKNILLSYKPNNITKTKRIKKVFDGNKLKLACTSTKQSARFKWLRNGEFIRKSKDMSIKKKYKNQVKSTLRIRKVTPEHAGTYTCTIDVEGTKHLKDFLIIVIQPSERQCADQQYCLNQGECWYKLPPLDEKYCKCHMNYSGHRCESVSINSSLLRNLKSVTGRNQNLTQAVIAIGAVLAVFTLVMIVAFTFLVYQRIKYQKLSVAISENMRHSVINRSTAGPLLTE